MARRTRRLLVSGVSIGVAALAVTAQGVASADDESASATLTCDVTELPVPDGAVAAVVNRISPSGEYLAGSASAATGDPRPTLWRDGELVTLDIPGDGGVLTDVNDSGVAVGHVTDGRNGRTSPLIYRDGEVVTEIPGIGDARLTGVNDDGHVTGHTTRNGRERPFVWRGGDAATMLPVRDGVPASFAYDINADGAVVGNYYRHDEDDDVEAALVWTADDRAVELPQPGSGPTPLAYPKTVSGEWAVTGEYDAPVRWDLSDPDAPVVEDLDIVGSALAVSSNGRVTGWDRELGSPVLLHDDQVTELPVPDGVTARTQAATMSADGGLLAGNVIDGGVWTPLRWNCR